VGMEAVRGEDFQQGSDVRTPDTPEVFFSGSHSRPVAHSLANSRKNTGKIVEKAADYGRNWRFFEGPTRHFAVGQTGCTRLQHARLPDVRFTECRCLARSPGPPSRPWAPFFAGRGTKRHI
jgi:hypothetical protein